MFKALLLVLFAATAISGIAKAQKPEIILNDKTGWHRIGKTTVNFQKDRDEIIILGANKFASIKFKVEDAPINLIHLEVYYASGDRQDIKVNMSIKAPGESRVIDLNGGERNLKKIVFVYKTLPNRKDVKAHIEVWGLKTNANKH
ncbi:MAG: hypothetical protein ABJB86_14085 [Bacteroidota bacterium]